MGTIESIKGDLEKIPAEERDVKKQFSRSGNLRGKRSGGSVKRAYWISGQGGGLDSDDVVYLSTLSLIVPKNINDISPLSITIVDVEGKSKTFASDDMSVSDVTFSRLSGFMAPPTSVFSRVRISPNTLVKRVLIKTLGKRAGAKVRIPVLEFQMRGFSLSRIKEIESNFNYVKSKLGEIDEVVDSETSKVQKAKSEYSAIEAGKAELVEESTEIEKNLLDLKNKEEKLSESVKQLEVSLAEIEAASEVLRKENTESKNNKQRLVQESEGLNKDISDKRRELRALESDRNILSDDYKDYVKEGRGQARLYSAFILLALVSVFACSYFLVSNALEYISDSPEGLAQTVSMIMQRSPFVLGVLAIAGAMAGFAKYLFDTVVVINEKRLDLTKLLILAKEVSFSANKDSVVDDEVVYRERVRLKLEMLKSHLIKDIGEEALENRIDEIKGEISNQKFEKTQISSDDVDVNSAG
jgi:hypothetical protein